MPEPQIPATHLRHVRAWVFDLDNTLYPPSARLFDRINTRMTGFIMRELGLAEAAAHDLRHDLWQRYGATLTGLIHEHGVSAEDFLDEAHRIDLGGLVRDAGLARRIAALPGRRIVHTNGSRAHAAGVLAARGLTEVFDQVVAIEDKGLTPKPQRAAYARFLALTGVEPGAALMVEDHAENLREPKRLGMATVWVTEDVAAETPGFVDHRAHSVHGFLDRLSEID